MRSCRTCQFFFEVFSVGLPRHAVDTRRGIPLESEVAPRQEVDSDVMQQCVEPNTLALSRRPFDAVSRRSVRAAAVLKIPSDLVGPWTDDCLYICIRKSDLAGRRFDRCWTISQGT
jgi:hypothetical protein